MERPPLRKEPAYVSKDPKYAVLAFGPNAETRVWLVLDLAYDPLREKPGDKVVIGPHKTLRTLKPGQKVKIEEPKKPKGKEQS